MARRIVVQIVGDSAQLERSFKRAGDSSEKFGKRMGASFKGMAKVGAAGAAAAGVAIITKQLFSSVEAAKEAAKAQIRLDGAFKSAGVTGRQHAEALAEISRVSKLAALDDEDLSDALARLTRTTGSVKKGLEGMNLAANIARARGISLAQAANFVEKAHVGQLRGLKSVGVQIDKNTTSQEALEAASRKFAGSAERYGNSAVAAQEKLGVAFENLQEKVGQKLIPVLTKLSLKLIALIDWSDKNWPRIAKTMQPFVDALRDAAAAAGILVNLLTRIGEIAADSKLLKAFGLLTKFSPDAVKVKVIKKVADVVDSAVGAVNSPKIKPPVKGSNVPAIPRAAGGPVSAGRSYLVGERGPELFRPNQSGSISANGGGGVHIANLNLYGIQNAHQFLAELQRIAKTGSAPRRGHFGGTNLGIG